MNTRNGLLLTMSRTVSTVLDSITATNASAAIAAGHAGLKTRLDSIVALAAEQALPTIGKRRQRDLVFDAASDTAYIVARIVLAYAKANRLHDLAARVDIVKSEVRHASFGLRLQVMQAVHDAAAGVVAELTGYGLTAALVADLQTRIDAARDMASTPRISITSRKVVTANLNAGCDALRLFFRLQLDPLMETIQTTDPGSYAFYRAARLIIDRRGGPGESAPPVESIAPLQHAA